MNWATTGQARTLLAETPHSVSGFISTPYYTGCWFGFILNSHHLIKDKRKSFLLLSAPSVMNNVVIEDKHKCYVLSVTAAD